MAVGSCLLSCPPARVAGSTLLGILAQVLSRLVPQPVSHFPFHISHYPLPFPPQSESYCTANTHTHTQAHQPCGAHFINAVEEKLFHVVWLRALLRKFRPLMSAVPQLNFWSVPETMGHPSALQTFHRSTQDAVNICLCGVDIDANTSPV